MPNFNASVPEVLSPDGKISKVIVFPEKTTKKGYTIKTLKVVVPDERGKEDETADLFQWSAGDRDSNNGARRVGSIPSVTHTIRSGPSRVEPTSAQEHARHQRQFGENLKPIL